MVDYKVSVIMPVFNAANFLRKALETLVAQRNCNLELIIVNDGSTDESESICIEFVKKYQNIQYYVQSNQGVSAARSLAITKAHGDYIAFMDADDWLDADFFSTMLEKIGDADILAAGCKKVYESGEITYEYNGCKTGIYSTEEERTMLYGEVLSRDETFKFGVLPYLWNKLIKREIVIGYVQEMNPRINDGEDVGIVLLSLLKAKKIVISDYCGYNYRIHREQACAKKKADAYYNASCLYCWIYERLMQSEFAELLIPQLNQYMRLMIWKYDPYRFYSFNPYVFPYEKVKAGSRIILYGDGSVGKIYYSQVMDTEHCTICAWADQKHKDVYDMQLHMEMISPEKIPEYDFDYIVIAIADIAIATKVKDYLLSIGIAENKLVI